MRHFKVNDSCTKKLFNSKEIDYWVDQYDRFPLHTKEVELPAICKTYTSNLDRARRSALYLKLKYDSNSIFNEVSTKAFIDTNLRFPKILWLIAGRALWSLNMIKKSETKYETLARAKKAVDFLINSEQDTILVISHGFFMRTMSEELQNRNFQGQIDKAPKNAKLYKFTMQL